MNFSELTKPVLVNNLNSKFANPGPANGVRPPAPSVISSDTYSYLSESAAPNYFLITISAREPYASEFLVTKYGSLQTRLGTNLGS